MLNFFEEGVKIYKRLYEVLCIFCFKNFYKEFLKKGGRLLKLYLK